MSNNSFFSNSLLRFACCGVIIASSGFSATLTEDRTHSPLTLRTHLSYEEEATELIQKCKKSLLTLSGTGYDRPEQRIINFLVDVSMRVKKISPEDKEIEQVLTRQEITRVYSEVSISCNSAETALEVLRPYIVDILKGR